MTLLEHRKLEEEALASSSEELLNKFFCLLKREGIQNVEFSIGEIPFNKQCTVHVCKNTDMQIYLCYSYTGWFDNQYKFLSEEILRERIMEIVDSSPWARAKLLRYILWGQYKPYGLAPEKM